MDQLRDSGENDNGLLRLDVVDAIRLRGAKDKARGMLQAGAKPVFVNGRKAALATLDFLLAQEQSVQTLYHGLKERMEADPVGFYQDVVMPLIPRNYKEAHDVTDADLEGVEGNSGDDAKEAKRVVIRVPDNGRGRDAPGT